MLLSQAVSLGLRTLAPGTLSLALLLGGCASSGISSMTTGAAASGTVASETTIANVRRVDFLTDYARLKPLAGGGGMLCWRNAGVNWKQYDQVLFERIQVFLKPGSSQSVDPTDLKMLIDYFHNDLVKAFQPVATVVKRPGPGVLQVRIALTELVPTNTAASLAGTAVPYGFVAEIGSGAATGKPAGSTPYLGQTGMEVQVRDGGSGQLLAECADREIGLKYAADMNSGAARAAENWMNGYMDSFTQWDYAKTAFDKWSADFAKQFTMLRNE